MKNYLILILLVFSTTKSKAQITRDYANHLNAWAMYFSNHALSEKWGLHAEAQFRRNEGFKNPQQLLLRTGLNYYFNKQATGTIGYCFVETYPYGEFPVKTSFPEHRIWEQIQLKNTISKWELIHRFRLEQRFVNLPIGQDSAGFIFKNTYSNRFRLLHRISLPFKGSEIIDKAFYASAYLELFINFGKNVGLNILDQNRAYLALGYKIPKIGRVEIGYLNQLIVKSDGLKIENNHTLQVSVSSSWSFKKK